MKLKSRVSALIQEGATKVMYYLQKNYSFIHTISRSSKVTEETNLKIDFNHLDKNVAFMDEV